MRIGDVRILNGGRHGKIRMMEDGVERLFHLLAHQEDALALVVGRVDVWRHANVKRMTHTSVEGKQMKNRSMQEKLVQQEVAIRQSTKVSTIKMLGCVKSLVKKGSVRRIWSNEAEEIEINHGRIHPPIMKRASITYRHE